MPKVCLTKREYEIAMMIKDGAGNREISRVTGQTSNETSAIITLIKRKCGNVSREDLREYLLGSSIVLFDRRMITNSTRFASLEDHEADEYDTDLCASGEPINWPDYSSHNLMFKPGRVIVCAR